MVLGDPPHKAVSTHRLGTITLEVFFVSVLDDPVKVLIRNSSAEGSLVVPHGAQDHVFSQLSQCAAQVHSGTGDSMSSAVSPSLSPSPIGFQLLAYF